MALLGNDFAHAFQTASADIDYKPIPEGDYTLQIYKADLKNTRSGGSMLTLSIEVLGPSYAGRKFFQNYNICCASAQAESIGIQQLKMLWQASGGNGTPTDTEEFVGRVFRAKVGIEESKDDRYGPQNRIRRYYPQTSNAPTMSAPAVDPFTSSDPVAAPMPEAASAPASTLKPWEF